VDIAMNIGIYYIQDVTLQAVWTEEKGEASVSSSVRTGIMYCNSENITETDEDHAEIAFPFLVSSCCGNSMALYLWMVNYGKLCQKVPPLG
jgi:hypothetical protein